MWYVGEGLYHNSCALWRHTISTTTLASYFRRGAIVRHILGSDVVLFTLHIWRRDNCCISHLLSGMASLWGGGGTGSWACGAWIMYVGSKGSAGSLSGTSYLHMRFLSPVIWPSRYIYTRLVITNNYTFRHPIIHNSRGCIYALTCMLSNLSCTGW